MNYTELQAEIVNWVPEVTSGDPITSFISLAEGDVFPLLKHYRMETTVTLTSEANVVAMPSDVSEVRIFRVDGVVAKPVSGYKPDLRAPDIGYVQIGNTYKVLPEQDEPRTVELTYFAKPVPLTTDNPSNWLLELFPAVYLHASSARAYRWRGNAPAEAAEKASVQEAIGLLTIDHKKFVNSGNAIIERGGGW